MINEMTTVFILSPVSESYWKPSQAVDFKLEANDQILNPSTATPLFRPVLLCLINCFQAHESHTRSNCAYFGRQS